MPCSASRNANLIIVDDEFLVGDKAMRVPKLTESAVFYEVRRLAFEDSVANLFGARISSEVPLSAESIRLSRQMLKENYEEQIMEFEREKQRLRKTLKASSKSSGNL